MTALEQFAWGFLGSMAVAVVALFRLFQKTDAELTLSPRYRRPLYWVLAANIGAATPAIVTTLRRESNASHASLGKWMPHGGGHRLRA